MVSTDLARLWADLLPGSSTLGAELLSRWGEPHRRYHDHGHLADVLDALQRLSEVERPPTREERLALWFHDAIHTGTPGQDERRSAELAASRLPDAGLGRMATDEVVRLVLVTIHHQPDPGDLPGARVSDADLSVLGADAARYRSSVAALRAEAAVSEAAWREARLARVAVLRATVPLFHTPAGRDLWQARAEANLQAEYRLLTE